MSFNHVPVLLDEVIQNMPFSENAVYLDGTLGGGGHSEAILKKALKGSKLFGIDRDMEALAFASERLKSFEGFKALHGNFMDFNSLIAEDVMFDGILLDLGVSSYQIDSAERGFSYHEDAPLDMRMDRSRGISASEYLNSVSEKDFAKILYDYADEKWASRIASTLIKRREIKPLKTTFDLVEVVDAAIPKAVRMKDSAHPARRTFQAVRIEVNQELAPLAETLERMAKRLKTGGRLLVISFHSIEDRLVKSCFQRLNNPCICDRRAPVCVCGRKQLVRIIKGSPFSAGEDELKANSRAHSAKLRVVERV